MPLEPLFSPFRALIEDRFERAKGDGGARVTAITLVLADEPHRVGAARAEFLVFLPDGPVRITWNGIASLWAFSQGAARLSRRIFEGKRNGADRLMVEDDPELRRGLDSLELARRFCTADIPSQAASKAFWPGWAPPIEVSPLPGSDDEIGIHYFRGALEWILRHELAHIALDHSNRQVTEGLTIKECESEADLQATLWFRGSHRSDPDRSAGAHPGQGELELERQAIANGLGLVWVALFEADRGPSHAHPPVSERLFACFESLCLREDSGAAEILADILQAWIAPEEDWAPAGGHLTARDALDNAIYRLHRYLTP